MYDAPYWLGSAKLAGKTALITGGDSGIGRAVAVLFAREGADVAIQYLCEDADAAVTRDAIVAEGRRAILLPGRRRRPEVLPSARSRRTVREFGALDVLVNNAAFQVHTHRLEDLTVEHFDLTVQDEPARLFFHDAGGAAANEIWRGDRQLRFSDGHRGQRSSSRLCADEGRHSCIHAFARGERAAARYPRERGRARPVWTPLNPSDKSAVQIAKFGASAPMKRPAQPEEIAPAFVFLASAQCSGYISGEILPVVGGYSGGW